MIGDLKPYPVMKDSGAPWLGEVPEHWEVSRLKGHLVRNDSGVWGDEADNGTVVLRSTEQTVDGGWRISNPARIRLSDARREAALLVPGDLVVTKSSGSEAHIGKTSLVSRTEAALECCFSNFMQRLRPDQSTDATFLWRCLNSSVGREQLVFQSTTTTGLGNLNATILGNCRLVFPPLPEQAAIVHFLDHADRRIRRAIRAKQKLIALLDEQKQALIYRAVTRGLDQNVRLKPSGVDWLGEIPERWEVKRLKTMCSMKSGDGITAETIEPAGTYPVYGGNGIRGYSEDFTHSGKYVLIGRQGALCGNVHIATGEFWASEHAVVASPDAPHDLEWFAALLASMNLNQYSVAAAQPGLAVERILNLRVPVPPPGEQRDISARLSQENATLDVAVRVADQAVHLLQEYRTRLIADVVTGKLDVREAAARLPGAVDEPAPPDEIDVEQTDEPEVDDLEAVEA